MIFNIDTGKIIVEKFHIAQTFWQRLFGLITYKTLPDNEGMILINSNGIHTLFMRFPIDVLYVNEYYQIIEVYRDVKPWKLLPIRKKAKYVIEIPAGTIANSRTKKGHRVIIRDNDKVIIS